MAGTSGTDTTFGSYTSANGERSETGYVNLFTGEVYALPGIDGITGGDGTNSSNEGKSITFDGRHGFPADRALLIPPTPETVMADMAADLRLAQTVKTVLTAEQIQKAVTEEREETAVRQCPAKRAFLLVPAVLAVTEAAEAATADAVLVRRTKTD